MSAGRTLANGRNAKRCLTIALALTFVGPARLDASASKCRPGLLPVSDAAASRQALPSFSGKAPVLRLEAERWIHKRLQRGNANEYTFCGNNPATWTDPTGEWVNVAIGAGIGAVVGGGVAWYRGEDIWSGVWKGAAVGAVGGATFGLGLAYGTAGAVALGAAEGGALATATGVVAGGVVAGAAEGATAWGVGMNQGSLAENVGYGVLFGGLTGGLVHGGGMALRAGGRYGLGVGQDLLTAMRQTPLGNVSTMGGLHGVGRLGDLGEAFLRARSLRRVAASTQVHHIATNKGAWAQTFADIFEPAGLNLNSAFNRVKIASHQGPHAWYNDLVARRLRDAVRGLSGPEYRRALINELLDLRWELRNTGLGDLIRAAPSGAERALFGGPP